MTPARQPLDDEQRRRAADNYRLARALAGRFAHRFGLDHDDCLSAAGWGLVNAARCWRPGGIAFGAYAGCVIDRELRHLAKRTARESFAYRQVLDLEAMPEPDEAPADAPLPTDAQIEAMLALAGMHAGAVRMHLLGGLTLQEIARQLKIPCRQTIGYRVTAGLKRIRKALVGAEAA